MKGLICAGAQSGFSAASWTSAAAAAAEESWGVRAGRVKLQTGDLTPSCKVAWRRHSQRGEQGAMDEVVVVAERESKKKQSLNDFDRRCDESQSCKSLFS